MTKKPFFHKFQHLYYEQNRKNQRAYSANVWRKNPKNILDFKAGGLICDALHGMRKSQFWKILFSYSIEDLIEHLENKFDDKMNWKNYGFYWVVDHKKPRSLFKYENTESLEFKECWALENLQPMEKIANIKKGNKYN